MKQILYVKYNKMRREPFQTRTQICEENGVRFVEKSAVRPQGIPHIRRFADSYQKMERFYEKVSMLEPAFTGDVMRYAYVEGQTLDELLEERIRSGENAAAVLSEALDKLLAIREGGRLEFERTNAFDEVFGAVKCPDGPALSVSNIDMLFENVIVQGGEWICLDYEWVFDFPIPLDFIRYRILLYFYRRHSALLEGSMDGIRLLGRCRISRPQSICFARMEKAFQEYVHGKEECYA